MTLAFGVDRAYIHLRDEHAYTNIPTETDAGSAGEHPAKG